jgi:hypothetical protein
LPFCSNCRRSKGGQIAQGRMRNALTLLALARVFDVRAVE